MQIAALQGQVEDMSLTVEALKGELISAHEHAEGAHAELEQLRSRALASQRASANEFTEREEALREAREESERVREEGEQWRREVMGEVVRREEAEALLGQAQAAQASLHSDLVNVTDERDRAMQNASNLQAVLEEFQVGEWSPFGHCFLSDDHSTAKDAEFTSLLSDTSERLRRAQEDAAASRQRAEEAEASSLAAGKRLADAVLFHQRWHYDGTSPNLNDAFPWPKRSRRRTL